MPRRRAQARFACALLLAGACTEDAALDEAGDETGPPIFEPPPPACGNGYLEPGEQCDDANLEDGDGCDSLCRIPCGLLWEATVPSTSVDASPIVQGLAVGPGGEIVVAGTLAALKGEVNDDLWLGAFDQAGAPLWSSVLDPQEDRDQDAAGVAIAADGSIYLAATVDLGNDDTDIWVARFDPSGAETWSASFSSTVEPSKDGASGITIGANGNPIVCGQQRITAQDGDVWLAELAAADAAQLWTSTWSGELADNGYSLDRGGPVAVGPNGTIWAMAVEYIDYNTFDAHLFSFDASGGLRGDWAPHVDESPGHEHVPAGLSLAPDGSVYFGIARLGPGATFWVHALRDGELVWVREMDSFIDAGEEWELGDLAAASNGNLFCGGSLARDEKDDQWREGWMHRLDAAGQGICERRYVPVGASLLLPHLNTDAIAASPGGELLIAAGRLIDVEDQRSFWVGAFRGP